MKIRFIIVFIIVVLLGCGLYGFSVFKNKMMAQFFASMTPPPAPVAVIEAKLDAVPRTFEAVGTLEAVRQVTIAPEVGGIVAEVLFEAGAEAKAGDALVRLNDDPEKGDLEIFKAQEKLAQLNLNRSSKLVDVAAPRARVDEFRAGLDEAKGNIARTEARIAQKLLRAPFDGVLGIRQVNIGEYLNPGSPVVTLTDLSELFVNFTLPEQAFSELKAAQSVKIAVDAWPGKVFEGKINAIEPQIGEETRTIKVQAKLTNIDKMLSPGMFAKVKVYLPQGPNQIVIPETAVDFTIYGDSVFVVREGEKDEKGQPKLTAERLYVKTGSRFENKVAVLEGLKAGDKVVTSGQLKLNPGGAVVLAPGDALAKDYEARKDGKSNE